jgi:outer membrane protein W
MKKTILFACCAIFSIGALSAQSAAKLGAGIFVGYPLGVFDLPNAGFHIGIHPTWKLSQHFSLEGQLSYTKATYNRTSATFGHDGGDFKNVNALAGLRIYFAKEHRNVRPYINAMLGYGKGTNREYTSANLLNTTTEGPVGISLGFFVEIRQHWNIGLNIEGPQTTLMPKIGYSF